MYDIIYFTLYTLFFSQVLTFTRLSMHFIIALIVGLIYFKVGQDAVYVLDNFNLLFFNIMFLMFSAFSATVTTCKFIIFQYTQDLGNCYSTFFRYMKKELFATLQFPQSYRSPCGNTLIDGTNCSHFILPTNWPIFPFNSQPSLCTFSLYIT